MKQRGNLYVIILIIILLVSIILLIVENLGSITGNVPLTGYATEGSTYSNVSITTFYAIQMSTNLTAGIDFGSVVTTGFLDQNATKNWCHPTNGTCSNVSSAGVFNSTYYHLNVSLDSNTPVDFCVGAPTPLTSGADTIGLSNETYTYTNVSNTNLTSPPQSPQINLTTAYAKASYNIGEGNATYWRFFLDIPSGQAAGTYNNLIYFRGIPTTGGGGGCGAGP